MENSYIKHSRYCLYDTKIFSNTEIHIQFNPSHPLQGLFYPLKPYTLFLWGSILRFSTARWHITRNFRYQFESFADNQLLYHTHHA